MGNPPITQVMLTVQFDPPAASMNMLDVARIYELFSARYPSFQQVNPAGPMSPDPRVPAPVALPSLPRVQLSSEDLQTQVLFQNDRFSYTWHRLTPLESECSYPMFEGVYATFRKELDLFLQWLQSNNFPDVRPRSLELSYSNAFNLDHEGSRRRISDIFTFFSNARSAPMATFNLGWSELVRPEEAEGTGPVSGVITVEAAPGVSPEGKTVALLSLTGILAAGAPNWEQLEDSFNLAHRRIAEIFDGAIQGALREGTLG